MPNLLSTIDASEYYFDDIEKIYNFQICQTNNQHYILKYALGILNNEPIHLYLLTDLNDKHLSLLRLTEITINNKLYHQINKSYSLVPKNGYGQILYRLSFEINNVPIISDSLNTLPGSFNLWKKLIVNKIVIAYSFNINTFRKSKINLPLKEFNYWGVNNEFLEAIKETPWQAVIFENEMDFEDEYDDYDDFSIDYLSDNDRIERTILSDYIVEALKNKKKIKDRNNILLLIQ